MLRELRLGFVELLLLRVKLPRGPFLSGEHPWPLATVIVLDYRASLGPLLD